MSCQCFKLIKSFLIFSLLSFLFVSPVWCQSKPASDIELKPISSAPANPAEKSDTEIDEMLSMELKDLLVYVASKRDERIQDAPGIVTVITREDIQKYGAKDLASLLDRLPNTQSLGRPAFQSNELSVRAIDEPGADSETVLPLLNGRPLRDAYTGAHNMAIYRSFPLYAIERIEVIRGPGSVLYGSNAFAGVINIITKNPEEDLDNAFAVGFGNLSTTNADTLMSYKKGEFSAMVAANIFNTDGWEFSQVDPSGNSGSFNMQQFRYGATGQAKYKDFTLNLYSAHRHDTATSGANGKTFPENDHPKSSRHFADLQYNSEFGDGWEGQFNVTYNAIYYHAFGINQFHFDAWDWLFEGTLYKKLSDKFDFFVGGTYERQEATLRDNQLEFDNDRFSYYGQLNYNPWKVLKLLTGVQVNKNEGLDTNVSLRAGAVYNITEELGVKLLYGEAYRSPNALEQGTVTPGFIADPDLKPQTIESYDAQLFYYTDRFQFALTFYASEVTNNIFITGSPAGPVNGDGAKYRGVEVEGKVNWTQDLETSLSFSYQTNETANGVPDTGDIANLMVKGGVFYEAPRGVSLGIWGSYFGEPGFNNGTKRNPDPNSFLWLSSNLRVKLRSFLKKSSIPDLDLQFFVENVLDERVFFQDRIISTTNSNQQRGDRKFIANVIYNF